MKFKAFYLGLFATILFLLQYFFKLDFYPFNFLRENKLYLQITGFIAFSYVLSQWFLSYIRKYKVQLHKKVYNYHKLIGSLSPLLFYFHSNHIGSNYMFALSIVFFLNIFIGEFHSSNIKYHSKNYNFYWMVCHVALASFLTIFILQHIFVVYYYE